MSNSEVIKVEKVSKPDDMDKIFSIRRKVFVEEQGVSEEEEYDEYEQTSTHYMALINDKIVATARWRKTNNGIKLERFAVLADYRSSGMGSALLVQILSDIGKQTVPIYLHAQITAVGLYHKFGFSKVENIFEEAGILHYKMVLSPDHS